jgi:hypothetical protein
MTVWEDALADAGVEWCRGPGCSSGSTVQHQRGFATAQKVHLTEAPPEDESVGSRTALHRALVLVGRVAAGREPGSTRQHAAEAHDAATEAMRAAKVAVPRDVLDARPDPEPPVRTVEAPTLAAPVSGDEATGVVMAPASPDVEPADEPADTEDDG